MSKVAYLRLSAEDGDGESSSISNQRKIITKFAQDHNMTIDEFYIDDGYSGFTMDRPAFNKLKRDLNHDIVDTIIFKDLSRLSRHNANTQLFLENIQAIGKRVLTVYEGYDTLDPRTHKMVGIYGWMNEDYIRDTSMKVKDAVRTQQKDGTYINTIPYGYIRDDKNKKIYYPDPMCAHYVRKIFNLYIDGMGMRAIAEKLNMEHIPTFNTVNKQRMERDGKVTKLKNSLWTNGQVQQVLTNSFYIGTLTLGKTTRRVINGKKFKNPIEKQYVFKNAHEPIIDETTFNLVQDIMKKRKTSSYRGTKKTPAKENLFGGLLVCADCGGPLTSTSRYKDHIRHICSTYNQFGTNFCTSHAVMNYQIEEVLISFLKNCRDALCDLIGDMDIVLKKEIVSKQNLSELNHDLERVKQEVKVLMEQKMRELIKNPAMSDVIDEMYGETINEKYKMINYLNKQIEDASNADAKEKDMKKNFKTAVRLLDEIINTNKITKKQVLLLVDHIEVYNNGDLNIYLNGNLHELCAHKVNIENPKKDTVERTMAQYILEHKEYIYITEALEKVKNNGVGFGYVKFAAYFKTIVEDGILIPMDECRYGYRLNTSEEVVKSYFHINNVSSTVGLWSHNNVTYEIMLAINDLCWDIANMNKKLLF